MITVIGEALINLVLVSGDNTLRALPGGNALVVATERPISAIRPR